MMAVSAPLDTRTRPGGDCGVPESSGVFHMGRDAALRLATCVIGLSQTDALRQGSPNKLWIRSRKSCPHTVTAQIAATARKQQRRGSASCI